MKWLFNLIYLTLILACSPLLVYKMITQGKYKTGWKQKFLGQLPVRDSIQPCVWMHAVSVGEVLQLEKVLEGLKKEQPETEFVITTTTVTGFDVAKKKYPDDQVCYFPLDFSWAVSNAIKRINPSVIILVELELWPNFILTANRCGVPLSLINGRMSENSFNGYRKIRPFIKMLFDQFVQISVQTSEYANRLIQLGADRNKIQITGSIKFDHVETSRQNPKTAELRTQFGIQEHEKVFIAGSTQSPEEEFALQTYQSLKSEYPELRLIIVPRHKERFEQVAELIQSFEEPLVRKSLLDNSSQKTESPNKSKSVLLLDTLGDLSACWGLADIAFVGGSLCSRGGQNMIEPSGYGAAVLFGPNTKNFRDVVDLLLQKEAAVVVADQAELSGLVRKLLASPEEAVALGKRAQDAVLTQRGATRKTVESILSLIPVPFEKGYRKVKEVA